MIAVIKIGGHQAIVKAGDILEVDKIALEVGKTTSLEVLLISQEDGTDFQIGTPVLTGVTVEAKVLEHGRGDKIRVFKMKPRKRYRRTQGHRQDYTEIEITKIGGAAKVEKPKAAPKAADKTPAAPKKAAAKPVAAKPAAKKAAPKKVAKAPVKK